MDLILMVETQLKNFTAQKNMSVDTARSRGMETLASVLVPSPNHFHYIITLLECQEAICGKNIKKLSAGTFAGGIACADQERLPGGLQGLPGHDKERADTVKSLEEIREDNLKEGLLMAYKKKFGKRVPIGYNGVNFRDHADFMERVQHAIDTNTPFPPPKHKEGCIY